MLVARVALTKPGTDAERAAHIDAHKAHLRSSGINIVLSGPTVCPDGKQAGAMVVAEVGSLKEFEDFSEADPFVVHGVYETVDIYEWRATIDNR